MPVQKKSGLDLIHDANIDGLLGEEDWAGANDSFAFGPGPGNDVIRNFGQIVGNGDMVNLNQHSFTHPTDLQIARHAKVDAPLPVSTADSINQQATPSTQLIANGSGSDTATATATAASYLTADHNLINGLGGDVPSRVEIRSAGVVG